MVNGLVLFGAFVVAVSGMACLAFSMNDHWRQVRGRESQPESVVAKLRVSGYIALCLSLIGDFAGSHATLAPLIWMMTLTMAGITTTMVLAYRPYWLGWLIRLFA